MRAAFDRITILSAALFALALALALLTQAVGVRAEQKRHHALSLVGEPKMPPDFQHFNWVNPDAPKGGLLRLAIPGGSFDSVNPFTTQGDQAAAVTLIYETLMTNSPDENSTEYGLLAEWVSYPDDYSSVTFKLREGSKFHDGHPLTVEDVIYSLSALKKAHPLFRLYYKNVVSAEETGPREVTFRFDVKNNRELPQIVGQLLFVIPKHYWEAKDKDGNKRDLSKSSLEVPLGSGPYRIAEIDPGRSITYERVKDYWGEDLPVNRGQWNFDQIRYTYYRDKTPAFEAFKAGSIDFWRETKASDWATKYVSLTKTGLVKKEAIQTYSPWTMSGFVFNLRRPQFSDPRVRRAFNLAFNFERINKMTFNDMYLRVGSFFDGGELAAKGLPEGRELEILNEVRDLVPPEVFTKEWKNPVNNNRDDYRRHLAEAMKLFNEAGWTLQGKRLVNSKGEQFKAEILVQMSEIVGVVEVYVNELRTLGIDANIRVVDSSQYQRRERSRDFDIVIDRLAQSASPGNEQREFWSSQAADLQGSRNAMGLKDPAVDKLIDKVIFAQTREELVAATRALDRVLLWHHLIVPHWDYPFERLAYWDIFGRPSTIPSQSVSSTRTWWIDPDKKKALAEAKAKQGW